MYFFLLKGPAADSTDAPQPWRLIVQPYEKDHNDDFFFCLGHILTYLSRSITCINLVLESALFNQWIYTDSCLFHFDLRSMRNRELGQMWIDLWRRQNEASHSFINSRKAFVLQVIISIPAVSSRWFKIGHCHLRCSLWTLHDAPLNNGQLECKLPAENVARPPQQLWRHRGLIIDCTNYAEYIQWLLSVM